LGLTNHFERGAMPMSAAPATGRSTSRSSVGHGRLYADLYSVAPSGIFVAADSPVREPADLAGADLGWLAVRLPLLDTQALEPYLPADKINLSFKDGLLFRRWNCWSTASSSGGIIQRPLLLRRAALASARSSTQPL
jgi:hypothetical protein